MSSSSPPSGTGVIGGRAFYDSDSDGARDVYPSSSSVTNNGIPGVSVSLRRCDYDPLNASDVLDSPLDVDETNVNGFYSFTNLGEGEYRVVLEGVPEGHALGVLPPPMTSTTTTTTTTVAASSVANDEGGGGKLRLIRGLARGPGVVDGGDEDAIANNVGEEKKNDAIDLSPPPSLRGRRRRRDLQRGPVANVVEYNTIDPNTGRTAECISLEDGEQSLTWGAGFVLVTEGPSAYPTMSLAPAVVLSGYPSATPSDSPSVGRRSTGSPTLRPSSGSPVADAMSGSPTRLPTAVAVFDTDIPTLTTGDTTPPTVSFVAGGDSMLPSFAPSATIAPPIDQSSGVNQPVGNAKPPDDNDGNGGLNANYVVGMVCGACFLLVALALVLYHRRRRYYHPKGDGGVGYDVGGNGGGAPPPPVSTIHVLPRKLDGDEISELHVGRLGLASGGRFSRRTIPDGESYSDVNDDYGNGNAGPATRSRSSSVESDEEEGSIAGLSDIVEGFSWTSDESNQGNDNEVPATPKDGDDIMGKSLHSLECTLTSLQDAIKSFPETSETRSVLERELSSLKDAVRSLPKDEGGPKGERAMGEASNDASKGVRVEEGRQRAPILDGATKEESKETPVDVESPSSCGPETAEEEEGATKPEGGIVDRIGTDDVVRANVVQTAAVGGSAPTKDDDVAGDATTTADSHAAPGAERNAPPPPPPADVAPPFPEDRPPPLPSDATPRNDEGAGGAAIVVGSAGRGRDRGTLPPRGDAVSEPSLPAAAAAASSKKTIEIVASPGNLGLVLAESSNGDPYVHGLDPSSPLIDRVQIGDVIVAVDKLYVRSMTPLAIGNLLVKRWRNPRRKISLLRETAAGSPRASTATTDAESGDGNDAAVSSHSSPKSTVGDAAAADNSDASTVQTYVSHPDIDLIYNDMVNRFLECESPGGAGEMMVACPPMPRPPSSPSLFLGESPPVMLVGGKGLYERSLSRSSSIDGAESRANEMGETRATAVVEPANAEDAVRHFKEDESTSEAAKAPGPSPPPIVSKSPPPVVDSEDPIQRSASGSIRIEATESGANDAAPLAETGETRAIEVEPGSADDVAGPSRERASPSPLASDDGRVSIERPASGSSSDDALEAGANDDDADASAEMEGDPRSFEVKHADASESGTDDAVAATGSAAMLETQPIEV